MEIKRNIVFTCKTTQVYKGLPRNHRLKVQVGLKSGVILVRLELGFGLN